MGNKVETILERVKLRVGEKAYNNIINDCGELGEKPTLTKQAKYTSEIINAISKYCNNAEIREIMQPCGYNCISNSTIEKAKNIYAKTPDIRDFLLKLNEQHIGGGNLHIDNDKIIGVYLKCYCGLAKASKNLSSDYCNCSAGWFKKLFSSVFDKDVEVEKMNTILDGADQCIFEITY